MGELAEPFKMSLAAASKHVKALEHAGLVRRTVRGRTHFCQLNPQPLAEAADWLRSYERLVDQAARGSRSVASSSRQGVKTCHHRVRAAPIASNSRFA